MIDKQTEELASLYVLDLLDGETLVYFESRIAQDPTLAQFVYSLHETTSALTLSTYPEAPSAAIPSFDSIQKQIRFVAQSEKITTPHRAIPPHPIKGHSWLRFWPIAATLLLAANLFFLIKKPEEPSAEDILIAPENSSNPSESIMALKSSIETLNQQLSQFEADNKALSTENQELASLLSEYPDLRNLRLTPPNRNAQDLLEDTGQNNLRGRLKAFFENNPNVGRVTIMELRGPESDSPEQTKTENVAHSNISTFIENLAGLVSVNESLLNGRAFTSSGTGQNSNFTNNHNDYPLLENTRLNTVSFYADTASAYSGNNINLGSWAGNSEHIPSASPKSTTPDVVTAPNNTAQISTQPSAFNVWDEGKQEGYLNVYNLPPSKESVIMWAKDIYSNQYVNVGVIPTSDSPNLSLSYTIPQENFILGKIIVTLESDPNATSPSERILLQ